MKHLVSFVQYQGVLDAYEDTQDLQQSLQALSMDGIELVPCDEDKNGIVQSEMVVGVHLPVYAAWMDFYHGNVERLTAEYGNATQWERFYGGKDFSAVMTQLQTALDEAQTLKAQYVVFHVSEVTMSEVFTGQQIYSDQEVIDASIQVINQLLDGRDYTFYVLFENLWWAGLNFQHPYQGMRILEGVHYEKKGFILDTGHLLCCNLDLRTQEGACKYLLKIINAQTLAVRSAIKAVHLHQSLSGQVVQAMRQNPTPPTGDVWEKFAQAYDYLSQVDTHSPWDCPEIVTVIESLSPLWVTHELAHAPRAEKEQNLMRQRGLFAHPASTSTNAEGGVVRKAQHLR